jgi:hypothetical protein
MAPDMPPPTTTTGWLMTPRNAGNSRRFFAETASSQGEMP